MEKIKVFAPASVANLACGYDVLGLALSSIGDELTLTKRTDDKLIISSIIGADISKDIKQNVIGASLEALLQKLDSKQGFTIELVKKVKPGSGLGSSASSSVAVVYAANELLGKPFKNIDLIDFAMEGEKLVSGKKHADNVAPSLLGGITAIRSYEPLDVFSIPFPSDVWLAIVHPQIEVKTSEAKKILKKELSLEDATYQWGNVAGLVCGLTTSDYDLIGRSMNDRVAEPARSMLIPQYYNAKEIALNNGALGFNISGSGPSVFALCRGEENAQNVLNSLKILFEKSEFDTHYILSQISMIGAKSL